jgi:hypothetical protein
VNDQRAERIRGALRYPCKVKTCRAQRGQPCKTKAGNITWQPHVNRQYAYMRNTGALQLPPA